MHGIIDFNCLSSSYLTFVRTIASRTSKLSYKRTPWFRVDLCNLWDIYSHGSHGWALIRSIFCSTSRAPPAKMRVPPRKYVRKMRDIFQFARKTFKKNGLHLLQYTSITHL